MCSTLHDVASYGNIEHLRKSRQQRNHELNLHEPLGIIHDQKYLFVSMTSLLIGIPFIIV